MSRAGEHRRRTKPRATRPVSSGGRRDRDRRYSTTRGEAPVEAAPLDGGVVAAAALLTGIGIAMVYSATAPLAMGSALPPHFIRHLAAVAAGVVCIAVVVRIPVGFWRRLALPLWLLGLGMLALTFAIGIEVNGATRWVALPGTGLRLQAAEFVKWATVLAVAATSARLVDRRGAAGKRAMLFAAGLMIPPVAMLLVQPDLGSAVVLVAIVGILLFVAGIPMRKLLVPAVGAALCAVAFIAFNPYALARMRGFLDPWARARNEGFQLVQSFIAFARGGTLGVGFGDGRQKLYFLPEAHTDFVLSVVAEEHGLLGVLIILGAFAALVVAGTRIAAKAGDPFSQLLAFGMTALIAIPAVVNAAVVMGLLPTTGFTLPFISFGANSLIVCSIAIGILLRIGSHNVPVLRQRVAKASHRGLLRT